MDRILLFAAGHQVDAQQDDGGCHEDRRQAVDEMVQPGHDLRKLVQIGADDVLEQDPRAKEDADDADQQVAPLQDHLPVLVQKAVHVKQEVILPRHALFIGDVAQVHGVEEGIEPDDRQQDQQEREVQKAGQGDGQTEEQHQGGALFHQSQVHMARTREQREHKGPKTTFFHCRNLLSRSSFRKIVGCRPSSGLRSPWFYRKIAAKRRSGFGRGPAYGNWLAR